jgi:hypothetical protein
LINASSFEICIDRRRDRLHRRRRRSVRGPDLVSAILIAGPVYPVAFGAIGGVIASVTTSDR